MAKGLSSGRLGEPVGNGDKLPVGFDVYGSTHAPGSLGWAARSVKSSGVSPITL